MTWNNDPNAPKPYGEPFDRNKFDKIFNRGVKAFSIIWALGVLVGGTIVGLVVWILILLIGKI